MKDSDTQQLQAIDDETAEIQKVLTNRKDDYTYARELLYSSAERLQDVLDSAVQLAQESEHPRAIEVATNTANALGDIAQKMMDHHIRTEKLNNPEGKTTERNVTNNNLNLKLNTSDLLEMLSKDD